MPKDTLTQRGLKVLMNSPANPNTKEGLEAFRAMRKASGMDTQEMLKYIGKKSSLPRQQSEDNAKQEQRLEKLNPNE